MTTNAQAAGRLFEVLYITLTISSLLVTILISKFGTINADIYSFF